MAAVVQGVPQRALFFGFAGVLPYAGTALTTIYLSRQASIAQAGADAGFDAETAMALLHHVEQIQVGYGAIILSFLGAIHWGFEVDLAPFECSLQCIDRFRHSLLVMAAERAPQGICWVSLLSWRAGARFCFLDRSPLQASGPRFSECGLPTKRQRAWDGHHNGTLP